MQLIEDILLKQYLLFNTGASINDAIARIIIENSIIVYCRIDSDIVCIEHFLNKNYPTPSGKWRYNSSSGGGAAAHAQNIRVPTEPYIPFYKLGPRDNIYDFISSVACVLHPREFISGERIQSLADVVIGDTETLYHGNPFNANFSRAMLDMDAPDAVSEIQRYERVFVFTHLLPRFYASPLGEEMEGRVLITHNSDDDAADHTDTLRYQFSQNAAAVQQPPQPLLSGIPIGIENHQCFHYSDLERLVWCDVANFRPPTVKTKNVYFYFSTGTHPTRAEAYAVLSQKPGLEWNIRRPKREYFEELARHRYAICPRGNGVDTHRVWECLYLNVIPIVVRADFIDAFVGLPIVVLENWADFDEAALPTEPVFDGQNMSKITMTYWTGRIQQS